MKTVLAQMNLSALVHISIECVESGVPSLLCPNRFRRARSHSKAAQKSNRTFFKLLIGREIFMGKAKCAACGLPSWTSMLWTVHKSRKVGFLFQDLSVVFEINVVFLLPLNFLLRVMGKGKHDTVSAFDTRLLPCVGSSMESRLIIHEPFVCAPTAISWHA